MRCTSKRIFSFICILCIILLTGCGQTDLYMSYDADYPVSGYKIIPADESELAESFAGNLCVSEGTNAYNTDIDFSNVGAAGLFDITNHTTLYAKNLYQTRHPASLTKVMTALVALKYGNLNDEITVSSTINSLPAEASVSGLAVGDVLTLDQALHALLICSGNDAAIAIAEYLGGSIEGFSDMMNKEALAIGATGSHFTNPHGLTEENHYVTAYDMYLIFNEALKYDTFTEIIAMSSYTTQYSDKKGKSVEMNIKTTNYYLNGNTRTPDKITVIGGKTGTTNAAGQCLILYSKDIYGNSYISVILGGSERQVMYSQMTELLEEVYHQNS